MLQLFLSYAHEDADRVRLFWGELKRPGIEPWMDYQLKLAGIWNDEIDERVKTCAFFIPILSKATQDGAAVASFAKNGKWLSMRGACFCRCASRNAHCRQRWLNPSSQNSTSVSTRICRTA
jgi:TIR domain